MLAKPEGTIKNGQSWD